MIAIYRLGNTIQNNFNVSTIMNDSELGVGIGVYVIGGGEGNLRYFGKLFFPRRAKLTFERIDGRAGYNRSGESNQVFYDSF